MSKLDWAKYPTLTPEQLVDVINLIKDNLTVEIYPANTGSTNSVGVRLLFDDVEFSNWTYSW